MKTTDIQASLQTSDTGIYCSGCNQRFKSQANNQHCPRCGVVCNVFGESMFAETLLIRPHDQRECPDQVSFSGDEQQDKHLDNYLGRTIHIYHCKSLLGMGGMGRVYLAKHQDLQRNCALKILSPRVLKSDIDYIERFQQEGRATAALNHPNIVTIHAIGKVDEIFFLEMEFVSGRSLQQLLADEGRLTPIRATALTAKVAEGLSAAHQQKILHRDLKPDNVLLDYHGIPKIADFGLAKKIIAPNQSRSEPLMGTPHFMAPELFQGQPATQATDVYALGVCYFLMLTGSLPFMANSLTELEQAVSTQTLPNLRKEYPDIPLEVMECLNMLLAKSPKNRPQNGIEASQLLHAIWGEVKDLDSLLREAFADNPNIQWVRNHDCYELIISLPQGRSQKVYLEPSDHAVADRLLVIYSVCCSAQTAYYEQALKLNAEVLHGSLAIREIDQELKFVMLDTYPRSTVDAEEVRRSVLEIAHQADAVEKLLTEHDLH